MVHTLLEKHFLTKKIKENLSDLQFLSRISAIRQTNRYICQFIR